MIEVNNDHNVILITSDSNRMTLNSDHNFFSISDESRLAETINEFNSLIVESVDIESEEFFVSQFQIYRQDKEVI